MQIISPTELTRNGLVFNTNLMPITKSCNENLLRLSSPIVIRTAIAIKTSEQVKADFLAAGVTISKWARHNNYKPREVSLVLNGQNKGRYGKGYAIAVALGI